MSVINCIILDDEAMNVQLLANMLKQHCPQVHILATATDAKKGIALIDELHPQLLFLDVEMPYMNGFDTLKKLEPVNFEVIFVTAYSKYAIEAFEHHAAGYVTKPVNTAKLVAAVSAATQRIEQRTINRNLFSLLEQSRLSVEQIAAAVGYSDPTALRRLMRKVTGSNPSQFRHSVVDA